MQGIDFMLGGIVDDAVVFGANIILELRVPYIDQLPKKVQRPEWSILNWNFGWIESGSRGMYQ